MPKYFFALLYMVLFFTEAKAQFYDDFSDSNFTQNPVWNGTSNHFIINASKQLQLNNTAAGESYLAIPNNRLQNTEWEFYVRLAFSPSASNFSRVYLTSDKENLTQPLHGFYIQLGEAGSLDGIDLFKQDSLTHTKLIDGSAGKIAKTNNIVRIKVTRNDSGNWALYSDSVGGTNFIKEGETINNSFFSAKYFGVYAKYTSTNASKFYWDDFLVKQFQADTNPPKITAVKILNNNSLEIDFNEQLDSISAENIINYFVDNGIGNPATAVISEDKTKTTLTFSKAFSEGVIYVLSTENISDIEGNKINIQTFKFQIPLQPYKPKFGDIIINEILPDPTPAISLPEAEFFELYNTTDQTIALNGWSITDGTTTANFPNDTIQPNSYIIVTGNASVTKFTAYGKVIGLSTFPSLNNSADSLVLKSNEEVIIDRMVYDQSFYKNVAKASGGWSLERISLTDSCKGSENWRASEDSSGGTPGRQNSIFISYNDTTAPQIISYKIIDSTTLEITFGEALDTNISLSNFNISPALPLQSFHISADKKMLELQFSQSFISNAKYTLTVSGISDCIGNISALQQISFKFIAPEKAAKFDILITEIMADPKPTTSFPFEYIELKNRSAKILNLRNYTFSDPTTKAILPDYNLWPDSFVVLCAENAVSQMLIHTKNLIGLKTWPSLNSTSDSLFLRNENGQLIYFVAYSNNWHSDDLKKNNGLSLEIIDVENPCLKEENWTSSKNLNGGTPGKINSVNGKIQDLSSPKLLRVLVKDSITLEAIFSEPLDGLNAGNINNYEIIPYTGKLKNASLAEPDLSKIILKLDKKLEAGQVYTLIISNVTDCSGNKISAAEWRFGLPQKADSFDAVINEILFNPNTNAYDFVEIYNRSDKTIDLGDLIIATTDENNEIRDPKNIPAAGFTLISGAYIVLTEKASSLTNQYYIPHPKHIIEMKLPAFNDDAGRVVLLQKDGLRLDQLNYSESWHFELLNSNDGVSLEKRHPDLPTQNKNSWHSAASIVGYATPTYKNSQFTEKTNSASNNNFNLTKPIFSPDNDGFEDVLEINYKMNEPGFVATISIFDVSGRPVKTLDKNQLLSTEGILTWNGLTENGNKAAIGVYVILIEAFHPNGNVIQQKLSCTLAGRL